ncbi:hypothetical protein FRC02_007098 [Tulasnella sp. 418]|nr:hypothetical protein FRC02_007098 [Tulasnella sp. 418]
MSSRSSSVPSVDASSVGQRSTTVLLNQIETIGRNPGTRALGTMRRIGSHLYRKCKSLVKKKALVQENPGRVDNTPVRRAPPRSRPNRTPTLPGPINTPPSISASSSRPPPVVRVPRARSAPRSHQGTNATA